MRALVAALVGGACGCAERWDHESRRRYGWGRGPSPDILTLIGAMAVIVAVLRALGLW